MVCPQAQMEAKVAGGARESLGPSLWPSFFSAASVDRTALVSWASAKAGQSPRLALFRLRSLAHLLSTVPPSLSPISCFPPGHCLLAPPPGSLL